MHFCVFQTPATERIPLGSALSSLAGTSPCTKAAAGQVQVWLPPAGDYVVRNAALTLKDSIFTTPLRSRLLLQERQLRHQGKVLVFASVSDSEEELGRKIQVCLSLPLLQLEFEWVLLS